MSGQGEGGREEERGIWREWARGGEGDREGVGKGREGGGSDT